MLSQSLLITGLPPSTLCLLPTMIGGLLSNALLPISMETAQKIEKYGLRDRGWYYGEILRKSKRSGIVEVVEAKGEEQVFHLFKPSSENAVAMEKKTASFLN
ncbi:carboxylesterase 12 [Pyrus ussuriensis x Pyrus communis]|uniref:Carboxylesterase 12 n=1 Tax=Pyrus ussuriensis x Pyrus communis TaxID=2448454 RepID=A0A5N5FNX1_9ROSA|nr:carboxylesterase 12 [Pyrus ussuriensis x Pyrus communis]